VPPATVPPATVPPATVPPATVPLDVPVGGAAHEPNNGSIVAVAAVQPHKPAGIRNQVVTAVPALLKVPPTRTAPKPPVTVVSAASAYPLIIVAIAQTYSPPAVVVPLSKSERADVTSEHAVKNYTAKAQKHKNHDKADKAGKADKAHSHD
ncbi:MAG: hypothetical protein ABI899_07830, partial [Actinomycetota bacterium]